MSVRDDGRAARSISAVTRVAFFLLLARGFAFGVSTPFLAIWLSSDLHASPLEVGLLRTAAGVAILVTSLPVIATDRTGRRRPWLVAFVLVELGAWLSLAVLVRSIPVALAIALCALGNLATANFVFASLGDWVRNLGIARPNASLNFVRMGFSVGFLAGPAAGAFLMSAGGARAAFIATACATALSFGVTARAFADAPRSSQPEAIEPSEAVDVRAAAGLFVALALSFAADVSVRSTLLPMFFTSSLHGSLTTLGGLFSAVVLLEIPAFVFLGRLADRFGAGRVVLVGMCAQAAAFSVLCAFPSVASVFAAEALRTLGVAATHGTAVVAMQRAMTHRAGLATTLHRIAFSLAPAVAAPLLNVAAERLGWRTAFGGCALMCASAVVVAAFSGARRL